MWASVADHRDGIGYFSDPLGKASLLSYWKGLVELTIGMLLLQSRRPADLAFAAVKDSGDGVTVSVSAVEGTVCCRKGHYVKILIPSCRTTN